MESNLSKIKPKLRTTGRVSGNFGKNKVKGGSSYSEVGVTSAKVVRITTPQAYMERMILANNTTTDAKLKTTILA